MANFESQFSYFDRLPDDAKTSDGKPRLNKWSHFMTKDHEFPGAKVLNNLVMISFTSPIEISRPGDVVRGWRAK